MGLRVEGLVARVARNSGKCVFLDSEFGVGLCSGFKA